MALNVLDLFSGAAGGWSLGLHRAGFSTIAACEADPWRRERFGVNFPEAELYDDVRTLTAARLVADGVGSIDVVAGSPPCQDASTANTSGKGAGGARTGLVSEYVRLVREIRPRWALFENVPGLRTRGIDWVLAALAAAGYPSWPLVVGAWHAGAPHKRNRVWVVATDATRIGRGSWGAWRPAGDDERQRSQTAAQDDPDAEAMFWPEIEGSESDGAGASIAADAKDGYRGSVDPAAGNWNESQGEDRRTIPDADEGRIRIEPGRRSGSSGQGAPITEADVPDSGLHGGREQGQEQSAGRGLAQQSESPFAVWQAWNGGFAGFGGMDDGLPKGVARQLLAAYGDAVVPIIPELIGRIILRAEGLGFE